MNKTYHARIFGGKNADWRGVDQGKNPFYPGALGMAMNATFDDNVFRSRDGQTQTEDLMSGAVLTGTNAGTRVIIGVDTDIFAGDIG